MTNVQQPADLIPAFAAAYQGGVESLLELYEPDAVVSDKAGAEHRGRDAIARELAGLVALGGTMTSINRYTIVHGENALLSAEWKIESQDATARRKSFPGVAQRSRIARPMRSGSTPWTIRSGVNRRRRQPA